MYNPFKWHIVKDNIIDKYYVRRLNPFLFWLIGYSYLDRDSAYEWGVQNRSYCAFNSLDDAIIKYNKVLKGTFTKVYP
jgi:hypothetical protein